MPKKRPTAGPVPKEAINFLKAKKLKVGFSYLDVWKEEHNHAFTVAKIMEADILNDVQESLIEALEEGITFRTWSKGIKDTLDKSGWSAYGKDRDTPSRLNIIFDTNMRSARAVGQWDRIDRTKEFRPFLTYVLGPAEKHRPHHESWAGTTLPIGHPWWDSHMPQNGWLCHCGVRQETQRVVDRRGGVTRAPASPTVNWKNPKTGKTEKIPVGIDPGFNHNPGKASNRKKVLADTLKTAEAQQKKSRTKVDKAVK